MNLLAHLRVWLVCLCIHPFVHASELQEPPVELRIESLSIGETYSFQVEIEERDDYAVNVCFYLRYPNKWVWSGFEKRYTPEEWKKLDRFFGPESLEAKRSEIITRAKFRVQITDLKSHELILDALVNRPYAGPMYMGRYSILIEEDLNPGRYKVDVLYLEGDPELASLRTAFELREAWRGK